METSPTPRITKDDIDTCWSAGHGYESRHKGETDPGATSKYGVEADLARELTKNLAKDSACCKVPTLFRDTGPYYLADDEAYKFGAKWFTEIHFNSAVSRASGVECLVPKGASASEMRLAQEYCKAIASVLNIANRGVKYRDDLAVLNGDHRGLATVIIEVGFISNGTDMARYKARKGAVEMAIFNAYRRVALERPPLTWNPRKTWRISRIPVYMKTV